MARLTQRESNPAQLQSFFKPFIILAWFSGLALFLLRSEDSSRTVFPSVGSVPSAIANATTVKEYGEEEVDGARRGASVELDDMSARDGIGEGDGAAEPLIRRESGEEGLEDSPVAGGLGGGDEDEEDENVTFGWFIWILTFSAGVSGLLFGYDTGVISSTLVSIGTDLSSDNTPLTTLHKSLITSATSLFALLASPTGGYLADSLGRRTCILLADVLFVIGAVWQALSTSVWSMVLGRSIVGLAVGAASFVTPLYIAELAPRTVRGRLVTVNQLFITGGQVVAYLIGWAFAGFGGGWRWMVGLGAAPAIMQAILMFGMPETPRWLMQREKKERARTVLGKVYGNDQENVVRGILKSVEDEIREERAARKAVGGDDGKAASIGEIFRELLRVGGNKRALTIACLLQGAQQLCGFNSLMYFSATIFAMIGFANPIATSLTIACTNFIFTLVTFQFIDRIGRRRILLFSIPFMAVGLALCAIAFCFIHLPDDEPGVSNLARALLLLRQQASPTSSTGNWAFVIVASMILYVAAYALGLGCVPWQQSELFPLSVRSLGSGIATGTNWLCNTIVGFTFLPMMHLLTPTGTFGVYAIVCAGSWVAVWMIYPETAGLGLEGVRKILENGWGVKESMRGFRERKRAGR